MAQPRKATQAQLNALIPYHELDVDEEKSLGRGSYGIVYRGKYRFNNVAVKRCFNDHYTIEAFAEFEQEAAIMAQLRCQQIIHYYGFCKEPPAIVMELATGGSLYQRLHNNKPFNWPERIQYAFDIAKGLHYLHEEKIIHRDLKSLNVLLQDGHAKLCDFGLARLKKETASTVSTKAMGGGTLLWMAPELFQRKAQNTKASDVYSLGMVLWELASRQVPWQDANDPLIAVGWVKEGQREEIPVESPSFLSNLIEDCWRQEVSQRPTSAMIVQRLAQAVEPTVSAPPASDYSFYDSKDSTQWDDDKEDEAVILVAPKQTALRGGPAHSSNLSSSSLPYRPANAAFFKPALAQSPVHSQTGAFLLHVVRGEQDWAEARAKASPELVFAKGKVTDYSERTFNSISALQYAAWAYDSHMLRMLLKYVPEQHKALALAQLNELDDPSIAHEHGSHYDFKIIEVLETYMKGYGAWTDNQQREAHWCKVVGGAQRLVPVHVANEYCRSDRSFHPKPKFDEKELPRELSYYNLVIGKASSWFPLVPGLGVFFALYRGDRAPSLLAPMWFQAATHPKACPAASAYRVDAGVLAVAHDVQACTALCKVRQSELAQFKQQLQPVPPRPANVAFFKPALVSVPVHPQTRAFLLHVVRGEQDKAEAMAQVSPELVFTKGKVTDYSERTFNRISALQYAAWAYDSHMLRMLLKYVPEQHKALALAQLNELDDPSIAHEHGSHYDFKIIEALEAYVKGYDDWNGDQRDEHWCKVVGGAQRLVPVQVTNEYCRKDRSFDPTPKFDEKELPRELSFYNYGSGRLESWFPLGPDLGVSFASCRCTAVGYLRVQDWGPLLVLAAVDLAAVAALCEVRKAELHQFKQQLQSEPAPKVRR